MLDLLLLMTAWWGGTDSLAVAVSFRATGGTITAGGLYTAGPTAGTYAIVATAGRLADTARVTLAAPSATPAPVTRQSSPARSDPTDRTGIPFGLFGGWDGRSPRRNTEPFTLFIGGYTSANLLPRLKAARARGIRLILAMTGGAHDKYKTDGVFDMARWRSVMDGYNTAAIREEVAARVADGTIIGNSVMDEPHNTSADNTWGPAGTMTKARVDSMCAYVKDIFPTLPVGVVHDHRAFEPAKDYAVCEFVVSQYREAKGPVTDFRDGGLGLAARGNLAIAFSLNILDGGSRVEGCPEPETGGRGTYRANCRMTPDQIREFARVLGPAACALSMWRYDPAFMAKPENQAAFRDVAAHLATLPAKPCTRR